MTELCVRLIFQKDQACVISPFFITRTIETDLPTPSLINPPEVGSVAWKEDRITVYMCPYLCKKSSAQIMHKPDNPNWRFSVLILAVLTDKSRGSVIGRYSDTALQKFRVEYNVTLMRLIKIHLCTVLI
jgi:hypothetical protein